MKEKINKIIVINCCIIFIISALLMGSPLKENFTMVPVLIYETAILYLCNNLDKKILANKIDYVLVVFCHTPVIPIILGQAINQGDTLLALINSVAVFWLYIMVKNLFVTEKRKNFLIHISILCGILLVIWGIDDITAQYLRKAKDLLNLVDVEKLENRMLSTLGYPNALAAILGFNLILTWERFLNTKKSCYAICAFILISGILLTYSKAVILLSLVLACIICILLKGKESIESIEMLGISGILAVIFLKCFGNLQATNATYGIWALFIIFAILAWTLEVLIQKCQGKFLKPNKKTIIYLVCGLAMFAIAIFVVGLQFTKPLVLKNKNDSTFEVKQKVYGIQPNTQYCLEFDVQAKASIDSLKVYEIQVVEENRYTDTVQKHTIFFGTTEGTEKVSFCTSEETTTFAIIFKSLSKYSAEELRVNKLTINGKERALQYQWIPIQLVQTLEGLKYENKSTFERLTFLKDGMKIVQKTWLLGSGTNCWRNYYPEVQEYYYGADQMHSFLIKVWMEYGIIGLVTYIAVFICCLVIVIKNRKNRFILFPGLAIIFLHIHSFFDFDLSFRYIFLLALVWIGMITEGKDESKGKWRKRILIPILILACGYSILIGVTDYFIQKNKIPEEQIEFYSKLLPWDERIQQMNLNQLFSKETLTPEDNEYIKKQIEAQYNYKYGCLKIWVTKNPSKETIELVYDKMQEYIKRQSFNLSEKIYMLKEIQQIGNQLEEEDKIKFYQLLLDYKEKNFEEVRNHEKNRYSFEEIRKYETKLEEVYCLIETESKV